MNIIVLIGIAVIALVAFLARTVVRAEYGWWGPRLARGIIHVTSVIAPRPGQREEWLGMLAEQGVSGVLFALQLVPGSVRMRVEHIHRKRQVAGFWREGLYLYGAAINLAFISVNAAAGIRSIAQHDYSSGVALFAIFAAGGPLLLWCARSSLRTIDVKWVESCLLTGLPREQLEVCLWTRGERAAWAAYEIAANDYTKPNGTPWPRAQRPLARYRMGRLFSDRLFERSVRRAERLTARDENPVA
jgi:hypothetical protein